MKLLLIASLSIFILSCEPEDRTIFEKDLPIVNPVLVTQTVSDDSDDPAIWVHPTDVQQSLILGTNKRERRGSIDVFDIKGKSVFKLSNVDYPNNIDVQYDVFLNGQPIDIAIFTERGKNQVRIYSLPDFTPVDNGGISVFDGEAVRSPMGIGIYKRTSDGQTFFIVSRKPAASGEYLWQYRLMDSGNGFFTATKIRAFGTFSGSGEIEAIGVDDENDVIFYSDERHAIKKYHADPDHPEASLELAEFGLKEFTSDREGIAIVDDESGGGYIVVSDQGDDAFHLYDRNPDPTNLKSHKLLKMVRLRTKSSDGCEYSKEIRTKEFPNGLFVAMSTNRTFHFYSWADILEAK